LAIPRNRRFEAIHAGGALGVTASLNRAQNGE
jgi:hypothetical protein